MRLLNDYQHAFPLAQTPYAAIASHLAVDEGWVRSRLARWQDDGSVSRVGAVFRPNAIGVSTLAAIAVPAAELASVAARVSARSDVNHNYEREHRFNLWFVATAADASALAAALAAIRADTGYAPICLPLITDYWIDLGFDLAPPAQDEPGSALRRLDLASGEPTSPLSDVDRRVIAALERGLPLVSRPYAALAAAADVSEDYVLARLALWLRLGVIKRLGVVVRHRELGYTANAMCVWDVPDTDVDAMGGMLARETGVTLCYRRMRARPDWPYNLYCMLHGRDRATVEHALAELSAWHGLDRFPSAVLFSRQRFKQRSRSRWASTSACPPTAR
ncbi:MAG: Lrp/AsnC family transcriptional regulator [Burkholderiales bacterium]|nr:Lrp/AsnC family transcriptional regulator [Burkholderiales bacterium]